MASPEREPNLGKTSLEELEGELRWTARAKETSASIFLQGRYIPVINALLEFTDNSIAYRNREKPYPAEIKVTVEKKRINVFDFGGQGANAEGIKRFALIGETEHVGISYRGAGAKYAAWFLGYDLEIRQAKSAGESVDYSAKITGFGDPQIEYQGKFSIIPRKTTWSAEKGRFEIIIRRLKHPDQYNLPRRADIGRAFGEVYRPLLAKKDCPIEPRRIVRPDGTIEEVNDRVVLFLATRKKKSQIEPLEIPLLEGYSEDNLQLAQTEEGELIWYWVGEKDPRDKKARWAKPGIRFYYDGRLLNIDYCGFNERDPRLAGLVGEAHLDNIIEIKSQLTVNKAAGIDEKSEQWQRIIQAMRESLAPFIRTLEEKPISFFQEKPSFLDRALATARRLADLSIREMAQEATLITPQDLRILIGETTGQRPPRPARESQKRAPKATKEGTPWDEQKGQTIPDENAIETIKRIRKSCVDGIDLRNLEDPTQVSIFAQEKDRTKRIRRVLILNAQNPLVITALLQGELAVMELVGTQLVEMIAQTYSSNLEDYNQFRRELLYRFGQFLINTPVYRKLESQRLQEKFDRITRRKRR